MNNSENIITEIEQQIIKNDFLAAAKKLKGLFEKYGDESLTNESILVLSRLSNFMSKSSHGMIDYFDPEFSKIRFSLVNLKSSAKKIVDQNSSSPIKKKYDSQEYAKNILIEDYFIDNQNNWPVGETENYKEFIKNKRYFIESLSKDSAYTSTIKVPIDTKKNFIIKARITFLKGSDKKGFGLIWGREDSSNQHKLVLTADGSFKALYEMNNERYNDTGWIDNPIIRTGKRLNTIEIVKNLDIIHFKINGEVVHTTEFVSFFGEGVGFLYSAEVGIAIDFFQVSN